MQRFTCIGLALPYHKAARLSYKIAIAISLWLTMIFVSVFSNAKAQSPENREAATGKLEVTPLDIGDQIPDKLWSLPLQVVNHPEGRETITLADYKGKLIILDFWATWCSSCIAAMPRIHEVEKEHATDMVVIPVSYEAADKVLPFLSSNSTVEPLGLYSVVEDEVLKAAFPHRMVPHYAWISPAGEVGAATTAERVNADNIQLFLGGEQTKIPVRRDIDPERPLFLSNIIELDDLTHYSIFTKGKYDGLPSGSRFRNDNGVIRGRALTNFGILDIYETVATQLFEDIGEKFSRKRLILDVAVATGLTGEVANLYSYELIVPVELSDFLYEYMLQDLNRYTQYNGHVEKRKVKCLVLTRAGDLDRIKTKRGKPSLTLVRNRISSMVNQPLSVLVVRLNSRSEISLPVVDETGFSENVDLEFSGSLDVDTLKGDLQAHGLDLVESYRLLNMFILEDKPVSSH